MESVFVELQRLIPLTILLSIRIGAALATLPAPLGASTPGVVRAALGVMIAVVLTLALGERIPLSSALAELNPVALAAASLGELFVGGALGLAARCVIAAAEAAGEHVAIAMGLGFASSVDPNSGENAPVTAQLFVALAMLLFLVMKGHHVVLTAIARSVEILPPAEVGTSLLAEGVVSLGGEVLAEGARIASPVLATLLVIQLAVGLVARAAPRMQVFPLSFAAAASVGMLTLWVGAPSFLESIAGVIGSLPARIDSLFQNF